MAMNGNINCFFFIVAVIVFFTVQSYKKLHHAQLNCVVQAVHYRDGATCYKINCTPGSRFNENLQLKFAILKIQR